MNRNYSDISYAESPFGTLSEFMSKTFGWMFAGLLVTFLVGIGEGASMVIWGTLLQLRVPTEMLGRVSSLDFFVSITFMPVSIAVAGPLSLLVPIPVIFTIAGIAPPVLALIALLAGRMRESEIERLLDER